MASTSAAVIGIGVVRLPPAKIDMDSVGREIQETVVRDSQQKELSQQAGKGYSPSQGGDDSVGA